MGFAKFYRASWLAVAAAVVPMGAGRSEAAALTHAVNVDFGNNSEIYTGTGADSSDTGTTWNGITWAGTTVTNLVDSLNNNSGISLSLAGGGQNNWSTTGGTSQNPVALMQDYRFMLNSSMTVTLSNVPDDTYKLFVYSAGDTDGQGSNIALSTANLVSGGVGTASTTGKNRDITDAGNPAITHVNSAGTNYVILDAVTNDPTATGFGTISFTLSTLSGQQYGAINGLQLQAVPEPAMLGTMGLAAAVLIRHRRRA